MSKMCSSLLFGLLLLSCLLHPVRALASKLPRYVVTDLGTIRNPFEEMMGYTSGWSINRRGDVVGHNGNNAILWSGGRQIPLGDLGSVSLQDDGRVIGLRASKPSRYDSSLYTNGVWEDRHWKDQGQSDVPVGHDLAISRQGVTVGTVADADKDDRRTRISPESHAAFWKKGRLTDLGTMGGQQGVATAVNDPGQIVGFSTLAGDDTQHGFLWQKGRFTDLGTMSGFQDYVPNAINARGQVTGWAFSFDDKTHTSTSSDHAFIWKHGRMRDLGTLGGNDSHAYAINNAGQVVGEADTLQGDQDAFLYSGGRMFDLNTLIPVLSCHMTVALAVNDRGQIVVLGRNYDNVAHVYLLTPTTSFQPQKSI